MKTAAMAPPRDWKASCWKICGGRGNPNWIGYRIENVTRRGILTDSFYPTTGMAPKWRFGEEIGLATVDLDAGSRTINSILHIIARWTANGTGSGR